MSFAPRIGRWLSAALKVGRDWRLRRLLGRVLAALARREGVNLRENDQEVLKRKRCSKALLERILRMSEFEPSDERLKFGDTQLSCLEWREVKPLSFTGRKFLIRERGGKGRSFAVSISGRVLEMFGFVRDEDAPRGLMAIVVADGIQDVVDGREKLPEPGKTLLIWIDTKDFENVGVSPQ